MVCLSCVYLKRIPQTIFSNMFPLAEDCEGVSSSGLRGRVLTNSRSNVDRNGSCIVLHLMLFDFNKTLEEVFIDFSLFSDIFGFSC